jgi:hypothetical protein
MKVMTGEWGYKQGGGTSSVNEQLGALTLRKGLSFQLV